MRMTTEMVYSRYQTKRFKVVREHQEFFYLDLEFEPTRTVQTFLQNKNRNESILRTIAAIRPQYCLQYFILLIFLSSIWQVGNAQYTFPTNQRQSSPTKEVKIGVILTYATGRPQFQTLPFTMEKVLPAIKRAIDKIETDPRSILPGVKFIINERDSNCSNSNGPLAAIDLYSTKSAHLFLGPACDFAVAPVARYSGKWRIPVITSGALFALFGQKDEFKVLTRVQGSFPKFSEMFRSVLAHFNWTRIGLLFREDINYLGGVKIECLQTLRPVFDMLPVHPYYSRLEDSGYVDWRKHVSGISNNSRSE